MDKVWWWIIDVVGPVILLILLLWLVFRRRSTGTDKTTFEGTRAQYADEEARRREGTDDL